MMLRTVAELFVTNMIELVMLSVGLRARPARVLAEIKRPTLLFRELFVLALGVPLLTLLAVHLLPLPKWTAVVVVLFGISPTAPFLLRSYHSRGSAADKALAVVAVALASSVVIVPLWIWVLNRFTALELRVSEGTILGMLALKVCAPLAAGMLLRWAVPRVARVLDRVLTVVIFIAFAVIVALLLYLGSGTLRLITVPIVVAMVLISTGSAILGELAGGRDLELRELFARLAMNGNPAIALAIIGTSYPELDLAGLVAAYLICRSAASIPYILLARRRLARHPRTADAQPS